MQIKILVLFEIISIIIYSIMTVHRLFPIVIDGYGFEEDDSRPAALMAILCGWIFAPYFVYLAVKVHIRKK